MNSTSSSAAEVTPITLTNDPGDTAWMLMSTALVFVMTPGLAFFYGGLVRERNAVNTLLMSYICLGLVSIHWLVFGYTFTFGNGTSGYGNFDWIGLRNVEFKPHPYAPTIPHALHMIYQMMFAIITPAIMSGAIVERMSFKSYLIFIVCWVTIVYDTVAHWIWGGWVETMSDGTTHNVGFGFLHALGALDFAGGTVVHMASGFSALVACIFVGRRKDADHEILPFNVPFTLLGAALLWFGWFGFNGGSALGSTELAVLAFTNTHIATATAFFTWVVLDFATKNKVTPVGAASGAVVGLVAITPSSGYVHMQSSLAIGFIATVCVYFFLVAKAKHFSRLFPQIDDALDVFSCHGVAGTVGCLLTGCFASLDANPAGANGLFFGGPMLLAYQLVAIVSTIAIACGCTAGLMFILKFTIGLAVDNAELGMDVIDHGMKSAMTEQEKAKIFDGMEVLDDISLTVKKDDDHLNSLHVDSPRSRASVPEFPAHWRASTMITVPITGDDPTTATASDVTFTDHKPDLSDE